MEQQQSEVCGGGVGRLLLLLATSLIACPFYFYLQENVKKERVEKKAKKVRNALENFYF